MSGITTHILDVSIGKPAAGVSVKLERGTDDGGWKSVGTQTTDADGRARELVGDERQLEVAEYRLRFNVEDYFRSLQVETFYREITITFTVDDASQHYHVPLLLSPFGYSTYRGS